MNPTPFTDEDLTDEPIVVPAERKPTQQEAWQKLPDIRDVLLTENSFLHPDNVTRIHDSVVVDVPPEKVQDFWSHDKVQDLWSRISYVGTPKSENNPLTQMWKDAVIKVTGPNANGDDFSQVLDKPLLVDMRDVRAVDEPIKVTRTETKPPMSLTMQEFVDSANETIKMAKHAKTKTFAVDSCLPKDLFDGCIEPVKSEAFTIPAEIVPTVMKEKLLPEGVAWVMVAGNTARVVKLSPGKPTCYADVPAHGPIEWDKVVWVEIKEEAPKPEPCFGVSNRAGIYRAWWIGKRMQEIMRHRMLPTRTEASKIDRASGPDKTIRTLVAFGHIQGPSFHTLPEECDEPVFVTKKKD